MLCITVMHYPFRYTVLFLFVHNTKLLLPGNQNQSLCSSALHTGMCNQQGWTYCLYSKLLHKGSKEIKKFYLIKKRL